MTPQDAYIAMHNNSGIKVGDTVKVLRVAKSYENGWCFPWIDSMNHLVGEKSIVKYDVGGSGFMLQNDKTYPFFCS